MAGKIDLETACQWIEIAAKEFNPMYLHLIDGVPGKNRAAKIGKTILDRYDEYGYLDSTIKEKLVTKLAEMNR